MSLQRRREIASRGGVAAHLKGTAHKWTRQEAREAGLKSRRRLRTNHTNQNGLVAVPQARPPLPLPVSLDTQPPSPWLESLRKNLEDLFASQKRATHETPVTGPSGELSA
jgi:hypothetical protein